MADIPLRVKATYDGRQLDAGLNRLQGQAKRLQATLGAAFGAFITIQGLRMLTRATGEVIKLGGSVAALKVQLDGTGVSFDTLIKQLREATAGQVSLKDLVQASNSAIALLGREAIPRLGELAEVAAKASTALGTDLTQAFNDIVTGVGRQSRLILDNLGIIIDAKKAYEDYADSIGKATDELTEMERKQAFLNEVIAQGNEKFGDIEAIVNPLARVKSAVQDLSDVLIGKLFGVEAEEGVNSLADAIRRLVESLERIDAKTVQDIAKSLAAIAATGAAASGLGGFIRNLTGIGVVVALFKDQMIKVLAPMRVFVDVVRQMATATAGQHIIVEGLSLRFAQLAGFIGTMLRSAKQFRIGLGRLSIPLLLISGLMATWRENLDNVWAAIKNLVFAVGNIFGALGDLLRMVNINIDVLGTLQVILDTLAVIINLIGVGITTITGFINIIAAAIRDLTSALRTGTLSWDNFNIAMDKTIGNSTTIINKIRELTGFAPIQTTEEIAQQAAFQALSQTSQQENLLGRFFQTVTSPGVSPGDGGDDDIVLGGGATQIAKTKADILAAQQAVRDFITAEKQLALQRIEDKDDIVDVMEEMRLETDKNVAAFLDRIEAQKIEAQVLLDIKRALISGKTGEKGLITGQAIFGPDGEKVSGLSKAELIAQIRQEQLDDIFDDFLIGLSNIFDKFAKEIGDISDLFGDFGPFANQLLGLGGEAFGASLFGEGGFAAGGAFAETGALAGLGPGLVASASIGLGGFALNRLFGGDKPIEIDQPIDIRVVDIETHLLNFFNFRGIEGQTFQSDFRETFEAGLFR